MTQTKTQEIEALKGTVTERDATIADLTRKVESLKSEAARSNEKAEYWRKTYNSACENNGRRLDNLRTIHSQEMNRLRSSYEKRIETLSAGAAQMLTEVALTAGEKLADQAREANAIIRDLKVSAAIEIEKTRSDTLAYAFEHVTQKLANNANAAELHIRAHSPRDTDTLN